MSMFTRLFNESKSVRESREKSLSLSLDEKRKSYACKSSYVTLDSIPNWTQYFNGNKLTEIQDQVLKIKKQKIIPDIKPDSNLNSKISVFVGDITSLEIDAIVNAANKTLLG